MIVVVGEALVDLVIDPEGRVTAALGGAPYNTARTCGRLGAPVAFAGAISVDRFGTLLADRLVADGVDVGYVPRCELPTTLAAAEIDEHGAASYRFYFDGTSAPDVTEVPHVPGTTVLFTGGLGLVFQPMADAVERAVLAAAASTMVMVDVNCRPLVIADRASYVARVERMVARADVVKVSDDDLAYLAPGERSIDAARTLLGQGPRVVLLTAGGGSVHVITASGERDVPVPQVDVVDTIGAGDSFGGGFLSWWTAAGHAVDRLGDLDAVVPAVAAAITVAGVTCTRRGAEPPWRHELPADWAP